MALFTDGSITKLEDLQALDSAILETARTEGIVLPSKLDTAREAIGLELAVFLLRMQRSDVLGSTSAFPGVGPGYDLGRVVVTPALHRWHTLRTLAEVYRDAYGNQLNDRYLGKRDQYQQLAQETAGQLFDLGVGLVWNPIPRPAKPQVSGVSGGSYQGPYFTAVAWRNASGQSGAASEISVYDTTSTELLVVNAGAAPAGCTGFDVYVGATSDTMQKQNTTPITAGSTWTMPAGGMIAGAAPPSGQTPEYFVRRLRTF